MFTSPSFDGPWEQTAPLFTTNLTYRGYGHPQTGHVTREFVTSGYFGGIPGDPHTDSATGVGLSRVVTQNNGGATFWVGQQTGGPGAPFEPLWDTPGAVGYYDFGSLTMARTLGSRERRSAVLGARRAPAVLTPRRASSAGPPCTCLEASPRSRLGPSRRHALPSRDLNLPRSSCRARRARTRTCPWTTSS